VWGSSRHRIGPWVAAALVAVALAGCSGADSSDPLISGRSTYGNICSACHGRAGQGGIGPNLSTVTEVFPSCEDQIRWISLGSDRFKAEVGPTYGEMNAPIKGGMPSMAEQLEPAEIAEVAAFERMQFGGLDRDEALRQCGVPMPGPSEE